jgi:hypothetical protein
MTSWRGRTGVDASSLALHDEIVGRDLVDLILVADVIFIALMCVILEGLDGHFVWVTHLSPLPRLLKPENHRAAFRDAGVGDDEIQRLGPVV